MKKRIFQVMCLVMCLAIVCTLGIVNGENKIQIDDQEAPLVNGIGTLLTEQEEDINVIPDKYNTGAKGELIPVTSECYISGVKFGTTGVNDRKLDLYYQPKGIVIPSTILVENYDFSSSDFREYNINKVQKKVTIIYRNCKFKSYVMSAGGMVEHKFENCTFTHFAGSDAIFDNCYFGSGIDGDGINPIENCTFNNCMIADLIQPSDEASGKHIDGFQIFGNTDGTDNTDIILNNCRFEVPYIPMTTPSGALNCPVSIIMRYSNANNIIFDNCYVNGGNYYALMVVANNQKVNNLVVKRMKIGSNSKSMYVCDDTFKGMIEKNVDAIDSLYVASVRKLNDGIHLSVTNDTSEERVLSVLTAAGVKEYVIPPCYKGIELQSDMYTYSQFPFDMDIVIENTDWIACFDTTKEINQIRFVNWSDEEIYVDIEKALRVHQESKGDDDILEKNNPSYDSEQKDEVVIEENNEVNHKGVCGKNVEYSLDDGILVLKGAGATYDYHSEKLAPWYDVRKDITEVRIEEGITKLGNQLFVECDNLSNVYIAEGLEEIGGVVFKRCNNIQVITVPKTLQVVGKRSFTSAIKRVEYNGTISEWNKISFEEHNEGILSAELICDSVVKSGMCGENTNWKLTSKGILIISGYGATYDYHSEKVAPWYDVRKDITEVRIEEGITRLGNQLFVECSNIEKVYLAEGISEIGSVVFKQCKNIHVIYVPSTLQVVGKRSFVSAIDKVEYSGSISEWAEINFEEYNEGILKAQIEYYQ